MTNTPRHMWSAEDGQGWPIDNDVLAKSSGVSVTGQRYVLFAQEDREAWIPTHMFSPDATEAARRLKAEGILVFGADQKASIAKQVKEIKSYPPLNIVEHIGHYDTCFGYPDGRVFSPDGPNLPIAYQKGVVCVDARGTLEDWKDKVIGLLEKQHLPIFAVMAAFAAPLLSLTRIQGNYLIMFSGPARKGKTTVISVAASTCGPATDSSTRRYNRKFNQTMNRVEELLPLYRDLPMIIDELSSFGSTKSRQTDFRTFVHHLAGVEGRGRFGDPLEDASHVRTIIEISANDSLSELLSQESDDAREAVADRLIEIPVPRGTEGVFNAPHPDFANTEELANAINEMIMNYHGTAMPEFLRRLTEHRQTTDMRQAIHQRIDEFKARDDVKALGPISSRVVDIFGLVTVAGRLAKHYGILPDSIDCEAAALHCLALHLGRRAEIDPVQQLLGWVSANPVIDLRSGRLPSLSKHRLKKRGAFISDARGGTQLWVHPDLFRATFPNPLPLLRRLHSQGVLLAEGKGADRHYAIKRPVRRDQRPDRLHVFNIPDFEEWLESNGSPRPTSRKR